jgi:hypothetical protein
LNAPYFKAAAGDTFKGVEVALIALWLGSEQTHFYVAQRAEKQRLDGCFREPIALCKRADVSHGVRAFFFQSLTPDVPSCQMDDAAPYYLLAQSGMF